ncbi:hypothetical protein [Mycolicibacterium hippocampi]|uniref:Uncharacterized protein n=1 Tax=Mycolicibacterium hippocampi TaxID=659824 RepID=A0A7I9ZQT1_9MYCO|nr:hypothetical protein [Mycolicibacterium hippocampi]GFH03391.1 hypothetical protein MHIP_38740 [Mycolicibacterium hippocampi]
MTDDDPLLFVCIALYCAAHGTPVGDLVGGPGTQLPEDVVVLGEFSHAEGVGWHMAPFSARWGGQAREPDPTAMQHIAPDGSVVRLRGHDAEQPLAQVRRASALAGADRNPVPGMRWRLRCPECGYEVRRGGDKLSQQFDALAVHQVTAISLQGLQGR